MGRSCKKRLSTTEGNANDKLKKVRNDTVEEVNVISESESDTDTRDDAESYEVESSESDSDDEVLTNIVKPKKAATSTARQSKSSSDETVVTDDMINEKELEVEAITSHKKIAGWTSYCFKWKDAAKADTWETRKTARLYYPNHLRKYDAVVEKANEVEAVLACRIIFGAKKYLLKWKDTARGESWKSGQKTSRLCPDILRKFKADAKKTNEVRQIEAILSHRKVKGYSRYLVKWKDHTKGETWETKTKVDKFDRELRILYNEQKKGEEMNKPRDEVEAILSHKRDHGFSKYLVKWKDHSKGETWVIKDKLLLLCPQSVSDYDEEVKKAFQKENEVETIVAHKRDRGYSKYLVKWKDHSKGETWETTKKTMSVGQSVLDEFVKKNPKCAPNEKKRIIYRPPKEPKKERKIPDRWEESDTDEESNYIKVSGVVEESDVDEESDGEESVEWEVEKIVGVKKEIGKNREFLIRWKGYRAEHDSWEPEDQLNCPDLIEKFTGQGKVDKNLPRKGLRPPPKQTDRRAIKPKTCTNRSGRKQK